MIKIAGLKVKEFSKQYGIGESTIYHAYKKNGEQGVIDLLTKNKAKEVKKMEKEDRESTKQFLAALQKQVSDKKQERENRSLKKEILFYQILVTILGMILTIVLGV